MRRTLCTDIVRASVNVSDLSRAMGQRYGRGSLCSSGLSGADPRLVRRAPAAGMAVTTSGRSLVASVDSMSRRAT